MRWVKRHLLPAYAVLAFCYLLLPIAVVIAFSFNAPSGRFNYVWEGFTLDNWVNWDAPPGIQSAVVKSLEIGMLSTILATALGTLLALAIVRHQFRGRGATNMLIFLPMSTPEIVLGASLLTPLGLVGFLLLPLWLIVVGLVLTVRRDRPSTE